MDPGTGLAIISLTFQVFAGCIQGFVLITDAYNIHKDAAIEGTKLLIQEQRLVEWAKAVNLTSPDAQVALWLNQMPAAIILSQLSDLLNSSEALKKRYQIELRAPTQAEIDAAASTVSGAQMGATPRSASSLLAPLVTQDARRSILQYSPKASNMGYTPKRLWWAAVDKRKYEKLSADVTSLVDGLWALLIPAIEVRSSQAVNEVLRRVIQLGEDVSGLRELQTSLQTSSTPELRDRDTAVVETSLSASAGIRAATLDLSISQDDGKGSDDQHGSKKAVMSIAASDVIDTNVKSGSFGIAYYRKHSSNTVSEPAEPKTVIVESRIVDPNMKRKLRSRVADLAALLAKSASPSFLTLRCIGFTEESTGFSMLFEPPGNLSSPLVSTPVTLLDALRTAKHPLPAVGTRLALAVKVAQTILGFHNAGWLHKDIRSENIMLFSTTSSEEREPYIGGFSFSRKDSPSEISENPGFDWPREIYRHPDAQEAGRLSASGFQRYMDNYALGCVMVEIAEWTTLQSIVKPHVDLKRKGPDVTPEDVAGLRPWLQKRFVDEDRASFRLGKAFGRLVKMCLSSREPDDRDADLKDSHALLLEVARCRI